MGLSGAARWMWLTRQWFHGAKPHCHSKHPATFTSNWRTCRGRVGLCLFDLVMAAYKFFKLVFLLPPGSFKIRGVANQFARRLKGDNFVTMSAGNYGKSFAYACNHYGSKGKVVMPETAPISRSLLIQVPHSHLYTFQRHFFLHWFFNKTNCVKHL